MFDKAPFYAQIGVRELLLINRSPWSLDLYQLQDGQLMLSGRSTAAQSEVLPSSVLPVRFRLLPPADASSGQRPQIEVSTKDGLERWVV